MRCDLICACWKQEFNEIHLKKQKNSIPYSYNKDVIDKKSGIQLMN